MTSPSLSGKIFQQLLMLKYCRVQSSLSARTASTASKVKEEKLKIEAEPPKLGTNNWIGPPDSVSNIRPIKFQIHREETHAERKYRQKQAETIKWNHEFWHNHNSKFFKEKEEFVSSLKEIKGVKTVSPEELSQFYRSFLNENRKVHLEYNKEWYKRNISLLWPALQVAVIQAFRRMRENRNNARPASKGS